MPPLSVRPALSPRPARRAVAPLAAVTAALFSVGVAVTLGEAPAAASSSAVHVVASVSGAAGGVTAMTLSTSGGVAFVVDGSDAVGLIDTATNAMTGATSSPPAWLGVPTDLATAPDDTGAYVVTDDGWVSLVHGDGSVDAVSALPGTGFGALAAVANGPSIVVVPSAVSPSAIYRVNVGAGTIFANFDGKQIHRSVVQDDAYIGNGSILVAPLTVPKAEQIAHGSVVHETNGVLKDGLR